MVGVVYPFHFIGTVQYVLGGSASCKIRSLERLMHSSDTASSSSSSLVSLAMMGGSMLWDFAKRGIFFGACMLGVFAMTIYFRQEAMLFHPAAQGLGRRLEEAPQGFRSPGDRHVQYETVKMETQDGQILHAWLIPASSSSSSSSSRKRESAPTVIFFHGNAGHIGFRLPNALKLCFSVGVNVVLVDYRGYGESTGEPSEQGLTLDGQAALETILKRKDIDTSKVFIFGRSLGGCVAIELASTPKYQPFIRGIIVENTFTSISDMVDKIFPFLNRFKYFLQRLFFPNIDRIRNVTCPVLFISGEADELIPPQHTQKLFVNAVNSRYKDLYTVPNGGHNDCYMKGGEPYFEAIQRFIDKVLEEEKFTEPAQEKLEQDTEEDNQQQETRRRTHNESAEITAE
eukprot:gb/GECG01009675.1/.p1 GENE.gb/GECG01009675.1/~~gb/GECG01009675.1/.p1  ORF type:complete len:400 (+),score=43.88 gb/GECG01009675.1/:1-1200(+)